MKQNINIWIYPVHWSFSFLLFFMPQLLSAQEESGNARIARDSSLLKVEDVLQLQPHTTMDLLPGEMHKGALPTGVQPVSLPRLSLRSGIYIPYHVNPSPLFKGDYSTNGVLHQFAHGTLYGSGSQTSLAGIGRFNNATVGYQHLFNEKFELQVRANAMKINMSHITGQAFSTSGALLYHPSEHLTFKFFGSYDIGKSYGMSTHTYGATISVDMSERFSIEMGVQRYYDAMSGRWETVPVVIPYYRFKKFTLGMDVGGIVYEILRSVVFDKDRGMSEGPTIGPPRFSMPIR